MNTSGFHEATVSEITSQNDSLIFRIEGVKGRDQIQDALLTLHGVRSMFRDGKEINKLFMETMDCEILTLEIEGKRLNLVVEWNDFIKHQSRTCSYKVVFGDALIEMQSMRG